MKPPTPMLPRTANGPHNVSSAPQDNGTAPPVQHPPQWSFATNVDRTSFGPIKNLHSSIIGVPTADSVECGQPAAPTSNAEIAPALSFVPAPPTCVSTDLNSSCVTVGRHPIYLKPPPPSTPSSGVQTSKELNRATSSAAACGGASCGGGGQGRRKGFARGSSFGDLACWAWLVPWVLLVLGGVEGVKGVPIPDCTYVLHPAPGWDARTCGIRKAVDDYIAGSTGSYGPIEDWDTSLVTDMSWLFFQKSTFNADISKWQVGKVTNMDRSTCTLSPPSPRSGLFLAASVSLLLSVAALILFLNNALSSCFFPTHFYPWTFL